MLQKLLLVSSITVFVSQTPCFADNPDFKKVGSQGQMDFVVVSGKLVKDISELKRAAHDYANKYRADWCKILIWTDAKKAARKIPMTDAQVASQYASYERNAATGLGRLRLFKNGEIVKELKDH